MGQIRENVIKMKTYHAVRHDIAKAVDIVASRRVLIDNRWKKFRSRIAFVRSFVPSRIIVYLWRSSVLVSLINRFIKIYDNFSSILINF